MKYKTIEVVMSDDITQVEVPIEYLTSMGVGNSQFATTPFATYNQDMGFLIYDANPETNENANLLGSVDEFECKGFNQNIVQSLDSIKDIGYNQF